MLQVDKAGMTLAPPLADLRRSQGRRPAQRDSWMMNSIVRVMRPGAPRNRLAGVAGALRLRFILVALVLSLGASACAPGDFEGQGGGPGHRRQTLGLSPDEEL